MSNVATKALAARQAKICRVFANPTRILILWTVAEREKSVGEIAQAVEASLQSTSQHLRIMKQANVLASRRDGQTIYYGVARDVAAAGYCPLLQAAPQKAHSSKKLSKRD